MIGRFRQFDRMQMAIATLGLLTICSLLFGSIGAIVLDIREDDPTISPSNLSDDTDIEALIRATVAADPADPTSTIFLANYLANSDRLNEAIPFYETAVQLAPDVAAYRLDFARSLAAGGLPGDAELQYLRALEIDPASVDAHYYLAVLYDEQMEGRKNDAIDHYERVIALDADTLLAERAGEALQRLGLVSPVASPV